MASMALQLCGGGSLSLARRRSSQSTRASASENVSTLNREEEKVRLGGSDLMVTKLGIGAWAWGDTSYWNDSQWDDGKLKAAKAAFNTSIDGGITFFDTAEVYGTRFVGAVNSETLLGRFIKERGEKDSAKIAVATKFAALPWRPGIWGNEGYIDGLGDAVEKGLVKAVGVSNYSEKRLRNAYNQLKKRGIPLASNQLQPLLTRIKEIGQSYGKTPTQVALNWLVAQGNVVPIPGAKNAEQATEFVGALGWSLTEQEVEELRSLASETKPVIGFPVEKL
ncbi:putative oxidoreductase [Acorus calamus]|uniref:Oxidoreductase n=1 Tax=Acorus calamus TaxID=4465 RepID=A0AAV9C506_ACOCL|nr:putative oxidoreductase [Acorus calamus]